MSSSANATTRLKIKRRPGDPWISKNRVLNGGTGKMKRNCPVYRNPNFDTDETKLLIQLWGDPKVQRELITTHKKHVVISQLAAKMEEYGFYRSPEEITTRIKNMKCFYNRLKRELESCKGLDPSWRHYAEMDAIMTRPIFSVRPNEVPAPSLKYLLEQEQEKRKERKRIAEEDGDSISESDDSISDILALPNAANNASDTNSQLIDDPLDCGEPDAEIEFEVDEKTLAALEKVTADTEVSSKDDSKQTTKKHHSISDAELAIKMEIESEEFQDYNENEANDKSTKPSNSNKTQESIKTIRISEDENLLVPKVEPIDVDEAYPAPTQGATQAPSQATSTSSHLADILKQPTKSPNITTQAIIKFAMPNSSMATAISSANTSMQTQSKISVVSPTILMPQQMSTKSSTDSTVSSLRQVRLGGNIHALLAASGSRTTVTNANGMKFLLVNAPDQRGPPVTTSTVSSTLATNMNAATSQPSMQILQKPAQFQQLAQQQQQQPQQQQLQQQQKPQQHKQQSSILKSKEPLKRQEYKEQIKKRELSAIKSTLLKLLKVQEDANEIQNQRLAIERERLQFERTMAEKFLNIFEQKQTTTTTSKVFTTNTAQNVSPSGQMMLPPKLLITTMVPTSAAQSVAGASSIPLTSNVLTSTGFTNRAPAKPNNDIQLLVPKEEPPN